MGIRYLNQFLQKNANKSSIQLYNLSELSGKKIAVDISIYLYRYIADNSLIDSICRQGFIPDRLKYFNGYNLIPASSIFF